MPTGFMLRQIKLCYVDIDELTKSNKPVDMQNMLLYLLNMEIQYF